MKSCAVNIEGATEISLFNYKTAAGWNRLVDAVGVAIKFQNSVKIEAVDSLKNVS
jgi:hypothetical protein